MKVTDFLPELTEALTQQLNEDFQHWGDTWLKRPKLGQEERTIAKFNDYFDQYREKNVPIPWLKIIGNALICWIREQHPEIWGK